MQPLSASRPGVHRIAAAVEASLDGIVSAAVDAIWAEVPAYAGSHANRLFGLHPHDVHLAVLPLFHSFGQTVQMNAGFATGATVVLLPRFDAAKALELMQDERVTFFAGVPTMYHALLNCEHKGRSDIKIIADRMRIAVSGGAALPAEVMRRFEERSAYRSWRVTACRKPDR